MKSAKTSPCIDDTPPVRPPFAHASERVALDGTCGAGTSRRVLVVDDNADGAEALAMLLELAGHEATTADGGPAALQTAQAQRPEVVFLDIGLPGMDGYEVARRLRADPRTAGAVLVALTGWSSEDDKRRSRDAGFDMHLTKPVDPAAVAEALTRVSGQ